MKRLSVLLFAGCTLLVFAGCAGRSSVAPQEVLLRATKASRDLQSASFKAGVQFASGSAPGVTEGSLSLDGRMQEGGAQIQLVFLLEVTTDSQASVEQQWKANGEIIVAGENEVYLNLHALEMIPENPFLSSSALSNIFGHWLRLPSAGSGSQAAAITPDPRLLRMQTEVVDVRRDLGVVSVRGRRAHHYEVAINAQKLRTFLEEVAREQGHEADVKEDAWSSLAGATGELWIDTSNYFVQGVRWNIVPEQQGQPGDMRVQLYMEIDNFNAAQPIQPPADAQNFPLNPFSLSGDPGTLPMPIIMDGQQ